MLDKAVVKYFDSLEDQPQYSDVSLNDVPLPVDVVHAEDKIEQAVCSYIKLGITTFDDVRMFHVQPNDQEDDH